MSNIYSPTGVFCNRTLNLRSIPVIGYDMDYTLVHYNVIAWEGLAYEHIKKYLKEDGWPVEELIFDPTIFIRGLIIDKKLGNIIKVNRFGYVKRAAHGKKQLDFHTVRNTYSRTIVELSEDRYYFLNTLFSISEACMFAQLVDLLDAGKIKNVDNYADLAKHIRMILDQAHLEGQLKEEIMANPDLYVELDEQVALTLLDQKNANKKLMVITNSGWNYTNFMMSYILDRYLPQGNTWKDLFDLIIVSASKPDFFLKTPPIFKVINHEGMLKPVIGPLKENGIYLGGNAQMIEKFLGVSGEEILYVGDHLFSDVSISKSISRWRTALIIREIEEELVAIEGAKEDHKNIRKMMDQKTILEQQGNSLRLALQRCKKKYSPETDSNPETLKERLRTNKEEIADLDKKVAKLNTKDGKKFNPNWGYLMRTGNDKSMFTRQVERYADIYTSRVSNLIHCTPFMYFRSPRGSMPHDPVVYPDDNA